MIQVGSRLYELLKDHKDGWNLEVFRDRYSEILDRYDYIVGDWGYNQLRLKGFKESSFSGVEDYIIEHCNFGCAYFILKRVRTDKET